MALITDACGEDYKQSQTTNLIHLLFLTLQPPYARFEDSNQDSEMKLPNDGLAFQITNTDMCKLFKWVNAYKVPGLFGIS